MKQLKSAPLRKKIEKHDPEYSDLELGGYTSIAHDAVLHLKGFCGAVSLPDLSEVDIETATILATINGAVHLEGIRFLSPEVAKYLVKHNGFLTLGLMEVSDELASVLALSSGYLKLVNLTALSEGVGAVNLAKKLSKDETLYALYNLQSVSRDVAIAVPSLSHYSS